MLKEIEKEGSFLGFRFSLLAFCGHSFYFLLYFKQVQLINIFYYKPKKDYWFKLFGKIVFSNCRKGGKNVKFKNFKSLSKK